MTGSYLFLVNTPAHAHLYRNAIHRLRERGHDARALARDYGPTVSILSYHDVPHTVYGYCGTSPTSLFLNLPVHYLRIFRAARKFDPDLLFGMGSYAAHAGLATRTPTVLLIDSEPTSLDHALSQPFADTILTPEAFRKDLGTTHYTFRGFKESAYLHPEVFEADPSVREALGVGDDPYAILRLNAFGSHHDVGEGGFDAERRRRLIESLGEEVTVLVSDEGDDCDLSGLPARKFDLHPARMHDALAEASLLITDTQTMATEAALLGTPTIRSNSFVGEDDMGNFLELERRGLLHNLESFEAVLSTARDLLTADRQAAWERRREAFVKGTVDLTAALVRLAEAGGSPAQVPAFRPRLPGEGGEPSLDEPLAGPAGEGRRS